MTSPSYICHVPLMHDGYDESNWGINGSIVKKMDRIAKHRKLLRVQAAVSVAALVALGAFAELASHSGHAAAQTRAPTPDQRITMLENAGSGSFFSLGGAAPLPSSGGTSQPQTSSGGS